MITNAIIGCPFYLLPVFFPNAIWFGLAPTLIGLIQLIVHGVVTNRKLKLLYNPGLLAVTLGHVPLGIYYIYYISANGLASVGQCFLGIIYTILSVIFIFQLVTYRWLEI